MALIDFFDMYTPCQIPGTRPDHCEVEYGVATHHEMGAAQSGPNIWIDDEGNRACPTLRCKGKSISVPANSYPFALKQLLLEAPIKAISKSTAPGRTTQCLSINTGARRGEPPWRQ